LLSWQKLDNKEEDMQKQINKKALRTILALTLSCSAALLTAGCGSSSSTPATEAPAVVTRQATLTTVQEVPKPTLPDAAAATPGGTASFTTYSANKLRGFMTLTGFNPFTAVSSVSINDDDVGTAGAIVISLVADVAHVVWSLPANNSLTDVQLARFKAGGYYVNVHTATNGGGVIRGQLISFADNIQPIFTANCIDCHVAYGSGPMSLVVGASFASLLSRGGTIFVIPGDFANSLLYQKISGASVDTGPQMPLGKKPLVANDQNLIKVWIDMGAVNN
jgi:hypothetical protein